MKVFGAPGLKINGIEFPKGSPFRECSKEEIKVLKKVPQKVFIFKDKFGNIINKPKEAKNVHKNRKPKQAKSSRTGR